MANYLLGLTWALTILACVKAPTRSESKLENADAAVLSSPELPGASDSAAANMATESPADASTDPLLALHNPKPALCGSCHENKRPAPTHYTGMDCSSCHNYPSFKEAKFSHLPKPTSCESCHARPTTVGLRSYPNQGPPAGFNANDPNAVGGGHYRGKDCSSCHQTTAEGSASFTFTHSKPKANFCLPCHFNEGMAEHVATPTVMLQGNGNCFSCHVNFDASTLRNWTPLNGDEGDDD